MKCAPSILIVFSRKGSGWGEPPDLCCKSSLIFSMSYWITFTPSRTASISRRTRLISESDCEKAAGVETANTNSDDRMLLVFIVLHQWAASPFDQRGGSAAQRNP